VDSLLVNVVVYGLAAAWRGRHHGFGLYFLAKGLAVLLKPTWMDDALVDSTAAEGGASPRNRQGRSPFRWARTWVIPTG
jgi:hypothetical protein